MPCLKCGGTTEDRALLCDDCADSSLLEPRFFLEPILIGPSLFSRLRSKGSAAYLLGPESVSDIVRVPSADILKATKDVNTQVLQHDELAAMHQRCDSLLAHLGVPLKVDSPKLLLTEDAADAITVIAQKVNASEAIYPNEGPSDLYIRMGIVYWAASDGILMRVASDRWKSETQSYLVSRAKAYLSKVDKSDELYSIAMRNMGMICLLADEWSEAEDHLSNALRHFPNDSKIGIALAKAHLMLGNQVDALARVDEMISQKETAELWALKGRVLRNMGRLEESLVCFNKAKSIEPSYLPAHDMLVETLRSAGRLEEAAVAEGERAESRDPGLEAKILAMVSEFKKAAASEVVHAAPPKAEMKVSHMKPAEVIMPSSSPVEAAMDALRMKDYDLAIQRAIQVLDGDPDSRTATLVMIEAMVAKDDVSAAAPIVHRFYERNNDDAMAWHWRGVVASKQNKWGAAVQYFSKAVSLDPKLVQSWVMMGDVLLEHDKPNGADESYSRALQMDSENPGAWFGKAKTMNKMNRWGAAIQCLDRYNTLRPSDKEAWLLKGDILLGKERYARAIEAYDSYLHITPDDSYALGRKGIALNAIGNIQDAKSCLEESVRLDPNNKEAVKWLRTMTTGGGD